MADSHSLIGQTITHYRIVEKLGGGMGVVYEAEELAAYAQNLLPRSVTSRPLKGDTPIVDLVLGYKKSNQSPILKLLLSRLDELVARASNKTR